jgi:uncharacterized membrane protein
MIIGGNWLNRIGAIVIVLCAAFFLKYAFDHQWINPVLRVSMGFAAGVVLLVLGIRFHNRDSQVFAQGLIGAGISIMYLSAYACYDIYSLVQSQATALVILSLVTVVAVAVAVKCDSLAISLLGLVGGFLTPLLISGGAGGGSQGNWFGLFAYITLLDIGLLVVAVKKDDWAILEPLTLAGTYLTYLGWHLQYYNPSHFSLAVAFLTVFWGLFYSLDVYRAVKSIRTFPDMRMGVAVCSSAFYYIAMYIVVGERHHEWLGPMTFMVAGAYFLTVLAMIRRHVDDDTIVPRYVLTAITLLAIGTSIQFKGFVRVSLWSVEALVLVWSGLRWKARFVWIPAFPLFAFAVLGLFGQSS